MIEKKGYPYRFIIMNNDKDIYPVIVFEGNDWEASMVKSLLENAEIEVFVKDGRMGVLAPWNISPGGADPVKIIVSNVDYQKAKEVVDEYRKAEGES
jgi:hypothetical protein